MLYNVLCTHNIYLIRSIIWERYCNIMYIHKSANMKQTTIDTSFLLLFFFVLCFILGGRYYIILCIQLLATLDFYLYICVNLFGILSLRLYKKISLWKHKDVGMNKPLLIWVWNKVCQKYSVLWYWKNYQFSIMLQDLNAAASFTFSVQSSIIKLHGSIF
jgi:hypothetical protein